MRRTSCRASQAAAILLIAVVAAPSAATGKVAEVKPDGMRGLEDANQVIVVGTTSMRTTHATARTYEKVDGRWRIVRKAMASRVGYNGLSRPTRRRQGDGTTPIGNYGFVYAFGSRPDPGVTGYRYRDLVPGSCWAGTRRNYNRWVRRNPCSRADENLWSFARVQYRYAVVMDFNYRRPVYGRGAGIFLHVNGRGATAGCVSLSEGDLLPVMRWMRPGARIVVGPTSYLRGLKS
jgi:L,D-peptidoglycan transpeptidase YkuD (ErfK/YbiS/YcfS/YnhG family)